MNTHKNIYSNYGCNAGAMWATPGTTWWGYQRTRLNTQHASRIFAISESAQTETVNNYWYRFDDLARMCWPHSNNANFVFFDGHTDKTKQFLVYTDKPNGWMWNHRDL
jgi:prepilin-type processing-associated H-X9-DG protein